MLNEDKLQKLMNTNKTAQFTFNLDYLLTISDGDTNFMVELMDLFLIQTPPQINLILNAIKINDYVTVANICHKIKPTFLVFGFTYAKFFFTTLEKNANKNSEQEFIEEKFTAFLPLLNQLYGEIEKSKALILGN